MTKVTFIKTTIWKRIVLPAFFKDCKVRFVGIKKLRHEMVSGKDLPKTNNDEVVAFWSASEVSNPELNKLALDLRSQGIKVIRIEDAFIRSNGLGCNFFYPYSLSIDRAGIYYDPSRPSDLENILIGLRKRSDYLRLRVRAENLRQSVMEYGVTKYHTGCHVKPVPEVAAILRDNPGKFNRVIFIPAQVDKDASVIKGGLGYNTYSLICRVRKDNPHALLIVKIHPDVLIGLRGGLLGINDLASSVDFLCTDRYTSLDLIEIADEVHTISSLTGFEALIRGKKVVCYGMPFYAGYGLTQDVSTEDGNGIAVQACKRRKVANLDITDLVIGSLILYPRYFNWDTGCVASAEEIIAVLHNHPEGTRQNRILLIRSKLYRQIRKLYTLILKMFGRISSE
ncbi:beta-3-deoxy-D-manno-oct-2-ulosonic acid transferase [Succinimonas amylolytica]|uniref:capsular polysaccharide export protein, LipB/KpsS family n=1 Tax=Succinimonas amylolytica TaxID=83769 RepID=UPI0023A8EF7A